MKIPAKLFKVFRKTKNPEELKADGDVKTPQEKNITEEEKGVKTVTEPEKNAAGKEEQSLKEHNGLKDEPALKEEKW
jgi:hypothetical protein